MPTLTKAQKEEAKEAQATAIEFLKKNIKVGDILYGVTRHMTQGHTFCVRFYIIMPEFYQRRNNLTNDPYAMYFGSRLWDITSYLTDAFPFYTYNRKHAGIELSWDNGQNIADDLSTLLFSATDPDGSKRVLEHIYFQQLNP